MQHQPWIFILALLSVPLFFQDPPTIENLDTGLPGSSSGTGQTADLGWIDIHSIPSNASDPSDTAEEFKAPGQGVSGDTAEDRVTTYTVPPDRILHLRLVLRRVDGLGGLLEGQVTVDGVRVDRAVGGNFALGEGDVSGATDGSAAGILFEGEIAHAGQVIGLSRLGTGALEEAGFILRGFLEVAPQ